MWCSFQQGKERYDGGDFSPLALKLGPVSRTRDHDFRYFFYGLLVLFVCVIALTLAWAEGYIAMAHASIGLLFSTAFAALFVTGLVIALMQLWRYSTGINALKAGRIEPGAFGLLPHHDIEREELSVIADAVRDALWREVNTIEYLGGVALKVGFVGTLVGLMFVFQDMKEFTSAEAVLKQLPVLGKHFALAFVTTLVGVSVQMPLNQLHRLARNAAMDLETRIMRFLREMRRPS